MNPDSNFNLPPPAGQTVPEMSPDAVQMPLSPEQSLAARPEAAGARAAAVSPMLTPQDIAQQLTALDGPVPVATPTAAHNDDDDSDDMEKQWVQKAKQIVGQTADNPYEQNRQLAHVRADYLQRRYGKVVKLAE